MDTVIVRRERATISAPVALALLTVALLLSMSVWLSASAVLPLLTPLWRISGAGVALLTASVQIGFAGGALASALLGLADLIPPRRLYALASCAAALSNAAFVLWGERLAAGLALRLLTGVALAGVYPVALKLLAGWFPRGRGFAMGVMIAGLTLGSALPHLARGAGAFAPWQAIVAGSSVLAVAGALVVWRFLPDAPRPPATPSASGFRWDALPRVLRDRPVMLATLGYFGHNWELYGMWIWLPAFLLASWSLAAAGPQTAAAVTASEIAAFAAIGTGGALGALAGGRLADRYGRVPATIAALAVSGLCALVIGWTFQGPAWLTLVIALVWGVAVVADSAQYSAAITELSDPAHVGTALTFQLATGFLITAVAIIAVQWLQAAAGWRWAFAALSPGPAVSIAAMVLLRRERICAARLPLSSPQEEGAGE
jgi:MFS family permease